MSDSGRTLPEGATPLDPDEAAGLIPGLTTRGELNAFEQRNIAKAVLWARGSRKLRATLLSVDGIKLLHERMFDETWSWAGKFRLTGKNLGVEAFEIQTRLAILCDDGKYWFANETYPLEHCAVRFHHKLVSIHPFANGNGRHARLVADLLMYYAGEPIFSWGGESLDVEGATRQRYLEALRAADGGKYQKLFKFALGE